MENSLYANLLSQHPADVVPMRCSGAMLDRLIRHLEDLVVDNKLAALVLHGRCPDVKRRAGVRRLQRLAAVAEHQFLFTCDASCAQRTWEVPALKNSTVLRSAEFHQVDTSQFMLIVEPRFSGLLASVRIEEDSAEPDAADREVIWSFDPNVVYTALEYMTARVGAYHPEARATFESLIRVNAPSSTSLRLTLNFTTKLALLLQRQTEMETATRRISALVNNTFDTTEIIEGAVELIGRAMNARRVSLSLHGAAGEPERAVFDLQKVARRGASSDALDLVPPAVEVPIAAHGRVLGALVIEDDTAARVWEEEELRMVQTVADQLAVGISHVRLFRHIEEQAITDELTGAFNKRYFVDRLDREIQFAERSGRPVALVLFDLDHFKALNDAHGHLAGDAALRHVGQTMRTVVRTVDVCARYGGEEFAVIMPSTDAAAAALVAERLRAAIAARPLERTGHLTASFGVSVFPGTASTVEALVDEADRALYAAKLGGRDQVRVFDDGAPTRFEAEAAGSPPA